MKHLIIAVVIVLIAAFGLLMWREQAVAPGSDGKTTVTIKAYFLNDKLDPEVTCQKVFPVERTVPYTVAVAKAEAA